MAKSGCWPTSSMADSECPGDAIARHIGQEASGIEAAMKDDAAALLPCNQRVCVQSADMKQRCHDDLERVMFAEVCAEHGIDIGPPEIAVRQHDPFESARCIPEADMMTAPPFSAVAWASKQRCRISDEIIDRLPARRWSISRRR